MSVLVPPPRLYLLSQSGKEEKLFCEDGSQRSYHVVVKNGVFSLVIGQTAKNTSGSSLIDFSNLGVICTLVYDQNRQKPVEVLSQKPMEYRLSSLQNGNELRVDARIKVLSSQFQGSLFCIFVQLVDADKKIIPDLCVFSHPIRVRSKIKPVCSENAAVGSASVHGPQKRVFSHIVCSPALKRGRKTVTKDCSADLSNRIKSEPCDDAAGESNAMARILQALSRIEMRQIEQQTLMDNLALNKKSTVRSSSDRTSSLSCDSPDDIPNDFHTTATQHPGSDPLLAPNTAGFVPGVNQQSYFENPSVVSPSEDSFAEQFLRLMSSFVLMPDTEKQEQLSMIQNYASENQQHAIMTLINSFLQSCQQTSQEEVAPFAGLSFDNDDDDDDDIESTRSLL